MLSSSPQAAMPPAGSHLPPVATFRVNQILSERVTGSPENACVQVWQIRDVLDIYSSNLFVLLCICSAGSWIGTAEIAVIILLQISRTKQESLLKPPTKNSACLSQPGEGLGSGLGLGEGCGSRRWELAGGNFWDEEKQMWTQGLSKLPFQAPLPACWAGTFFVLKELCQAQYYRTEAPEVGFDAAAAKARRGIPFSPPSQCQLSCPSAEQEQAPIQTGPALMPAQIRVWVWISKAPSLLNTSLRLLPDSQHPKQHCRKNKSNARVAGIRLVRSPLGIWTLSLPQGKRAGRSWVQPLQQGALDFKFLCVKSESVFFNTESIWRLKAVIHRFITALFRKEPVAHQK